MTESKEYAVRIGEQVYQATFAELEEWIIEGRVLPETPVKKGNLNWTAARNVPALRDACTKAKPPILPPPAPFVPVQPPPVPPFPPQPFAQGPFVTQPVHPPTVPLHSPQPFAQQPQLLPPPNQPPFQFPHPPGVRYPAPRPGIKPISNNVKVLLGVLGAFFFLFLVVSAIRTGKSKPSKPVVQVPEKKRLSAQSVVLAWLTLQKEGSPSSAAAFCNLSEAKDLFVVEEYEIRSYPTDSEETSCTVRIKSHTKGGFPIVKDWTLFLRKNYLNAARDEWDYCIVSISG